MIAWLVVWGCGAEVAQVAAGAPSPQLLEWVDAVRARGFTIDGEVRCDPGAEVAAFQEDPALAVPTSACWVTVSRPDRQRLARIVELTFSAETDAASTLTPLLARGHGADPVEPCAGGACKALIRGWSDGARSYWVSTRAFGWEADGDEVIAAFPGVTPPSAPGSDSGKAAEQSFVAPDDARAELGAELVRILNEQKDEAALGAISAPSVDLAFEHQCGENPLRAETAKLEAAKLKSFWTLTRSWLACDPENPAEACKSLRINEAALSCALGCCEVHDIGHNALWVRRFCIADGKVTSLAVRDGC